MDIKEIAKRIRKTNNSYMLSMSPDIVAEFAESLIESYKAELLNEVGEPTCWMTPDGEGWRMRTKPPETDTKLGWMEFYTSDQVAAAILKATKPLEDEIEKLSDSAYTTSERLNVYIRGNDELRTQLAKAEQRVAEACADLLVDRFKHEVTGTLAIRAGEWRKFVKEV